MIDTHKSLGEKFLKKGFWLYIFAFIVGPLGYITRILISDTVGVDEVGVIYTMISLITLVAAFNDFGVSESIKYYLPKYIEEKNYNKVKSILVYGLIAQMCTGIILTVFFYYGSGFIAGNYLHNEGLKKIVQSFAFYFLGLNVFQLLSSFFLAIQNTFLVKILEFIRNLGILGLTIFFIIEGITEITTFSYAWLGGLYISICLGTIVFYKKYFQTYLKNTKVIWDRLHITPILKYSFLIFLGAQSSTILSQMDMFMITLLRGTTDAGYYTNYISIINIPFIIIAPIFVLLFPIISELHAKNDTQKIRLVKSTFTKVFLSLAVFISVFFITFGEQIATILYDTAYITSGEILRYSAGFLIFNFLLQINFNIIAGVGKAKERFYIILIAIIVNFILNFVLLQTIGVYGAALATGIGWIVIYALGEYFLGREYRVNIDYKILVKNLTIFTGLGALFFIAKESIYADMERLSIFFITFIIGLLWLGIYIILNKSMIFGFVGEVKKLRAKK